MRRTSFFGLNSPRSYGQISDVEKNTQILRERALPAARELPGFKGLLSLADRESGKGITITLWESEAALQKSEEEANRIRSQAADLTASDVVSVERFEAVLDESAS